MKSKKVDVCGIGNALVDVQLNISDHELKTLEVEKGTMNLVDAQTQKGVSDRFGDRTPLMSSGGSAANTILTISQLGGTTGYKSILGDDTYGRFFASEFEEMGIHLSADFCQTGQTGTCMVLVTPDTERTMFTSLGVNTSFAKEHVVAPIIETSQWLYIEGYKFSEVLSSEAIHHCIAMAKQNNTQVAISFSDALIVKHFRDDLAKAALQADLIFCNEVEARTFTHTANMEDAFEALAQNHDRFIITRGEHGSRLHYDDIQCDIPAVKVQAIDSTGAGDVYAAGFLYGITHNYHPIEACHLGSFSASKIVTQRGPRWQGDHSELLDGGFPSTPIHHEQLGRTYLS